MKQTVKVTTTETRELPDFFVCNDIFRDNSQWYGVINGVLISVMILQTFVSIQRDVIDADTRIPDYDLRNSITEITCEEFKEVLARAIAIINAE